MELDIKLKITSVKELKPIIEELSKTRKECKNICTLKVEIEIG